MHKPETSPGAGAAPLAPGEEAKLLKVMRDTVMAFEWNFSTTDMSSLPAMLTSAILPKLEQARAEEREAIKELIKRHTPFSKDEIDAFTSEQALAYSHDIARSRQCRMLLAAIRQRGVAK